MFPVHPTAYSTKEHITTKRVPSFVYLNAVYRLQSQYMNSFCLIVKMANHVIDRGGPLNVAVHSPTGFSVRLSFQAWSCLFADLTLNVSVAHELVPVLGMEQ